MYYLGLEKNDFKKLEYIWSNFPGILYDTDMGAGIIKTFKFPNTECE